MRAQTKHKSLWRRQTNSRTESALVSLGGRGEDGEEDGTRIQGPPPGLWRRGSVPGSLDHSPPSDHSPPGTGGFSRADLLQNRQRSRSLPNPLSEMEGRPSTMTRGQEKKNNNPPTSSSHSRPGHLQQRPSRGAALACK